MGEAALDGLLAIAPYAYKATVNQDGGIMSPKQQQMVDEIVADSQKDIGEFVKKDLYDERAIAKQILANAYSGAGMYAKSQNGGQITQEDLDRSREAKDEALTYINNDMEKDSVFGEKSDALIESAGKMAAQKGLTLVGVPWFLTTGLTSGGSQMEQALKDGATYDQAAGSAAISAGADILSEKLFGGDFFVDDAAADLVTPYLATAISNKALRAWTKFGLDTAGEGLEEGFSSFVSRLGTALYKEESLAEILFSEEAIDEYVESIAGGMLLGGAMNTVNAVQAKSQGADFTTGLPKDVNKAIDDTYKTLITEFEHYRKASPAEKRKFYNKVYETYTDLMNLENYANLMGDGPVGETVAHEAEIEPVVEETVSDEPKTAEEFPTVEDFSAHEAVGDETAPTEEDGFYIDDDILLEDIDGEWFTKSDQ